MARYGKDEPRALPEGAEPLVGFDLDHAPRALHGLRPQPPGALHARGHGVGARPPARGTRCRGTSTRPTRRPAARPSTRSGAPARTALSMLHQLAKKSPSDRRGRHRRRPERAGGGDPARRGRALGAAARGRGRARRRGPHRGADAAGLQARHVLLGLPGVAPRRRCSRACRWPSTGWSGCTRPPPTRTRCPGGEAKLLYRGLRRDGGVARRPRRRAVGASSSRPFLDNFEAVRATMLSGFPPVGGPLKLLGGAGPLRLLDFTRMLPGSAVGLGKRLFERRRLAGVALRRRDARRHAARRRRESASPRSTSTCSGTRSAGRRRAAAPSG